MAKPFDDSTRFLTRLDPLSWARFLGIQATQAKLVGADLSTVSTAADSIIELDGGKNALQVEMMASYDPTIEVRLAWYNLLGRKELGLSMRSFLVLLCREAGREKLTGVAREYHDDGSLCNQFHYTIIRVWEMPSEELIKFGLGVLPLAFIADVEQSKLPDLVQQAKQRLAAETASGLAGEIWTAIDILMGLRYDKDVVEGLLKGVREMKESVTYQAILAEGEAKGVAIGEARGEARGKIIGVREHLIRRHSRRFGTPDAATLSALNAIDSLEQFDDLEERCLIVSGWKELLGD